MLCKSLIDQQHSVLLVSFSKQYPSFLYPGKTDRDPSPDYFKLVAEYLLDPMNFRSWERTLQRVINFQPDTVILPWWTTFWAPSYTYLAYRLRRTGIHIMYLVHNVLPHEQKPWDRSLAKIALQKGDSFIVQTEAEAKRLHDLVPGANLTICPHPGYKMFSETDLEKSDAKHQLGISPEKKILLFFGIVREYKGLDTLILALAHLHSKGIKPCLIVAGEFWQDKSSLLNLVEQAKISRQVIFEDRYISDQEVPVYFSAADIFVAPYRKGTQSGAAKLALGFNLPVVHSETIADSAIMNLENYPVYISPPNDPIELAKSLENALHNLTEDTSKPREIKDNGWHEMVRVIENTLVESESPDG
jgi:glycosyltransferase involved in cell wall biosynthesis